MNAADQLRHAATRIRADHDDTFHLEVADWLDYAADAWGDTDPRFVGRGGAHITPALAVAHAYLGEEAVSRG